MLNEPAFWCFPVRNEGGVEFALQRRINFVSDKFR